MPVPDMPFEEIPHTADWAIRAYGRTLPELFANAAMGMYSLLVDLDALGESERREVEVEAASPEGLLVAWLNELVYYTEREHLAFKRFEIHELRLPDPGDPDSLGRLRASAYGERAREMRKYIKAVTYHNVAIQQEDGRYRVELVFDV
ncbi:Protein archease [Candidatus Thermoflexus japonica]|uniref:Protein archease n=1 Tax=Candidatus Thermoflexus japonica TaxID=2035417 RepID=A0A2H5Y7G2_9CHLR|nr:Protein archease [Candidatus Thermoflexus japonica]